MDNRNRHAVGERSSGWNLAGRNWKSGHLHHEPGGKFSESVCRREPLVIRRRRVHQRSELQKSTFATVERRDSTAAFNQHDAIRRVRRKQEYTARLHGKSQRGAAGLAEW